MKIQTKRSGDVKKKTEKIIQLVPAEGWWAAFEAVDEKGQSLFYVEPLALWALVEVSDKYREGDPDWEIRGITGHDAAWGGYVENVENFTGYVKAATEEEALLKAGKLV